jgi:glycosyltransferase involved in cell wall biosynthesis
MTPDLPDEPLVSVVIAVYDGERHLGEAIDSVLGQTWVHLELIVVNDGSTDRTGEVVAARQHDERLRRVDQENQGVARARNAGIAQARGDLVAFLDADDVWLPDKLERQVEVFRRHPDVGLVFCGYAITDEHLHERSVVLPRRRHHDMVKWLMLEGNGMGLAFTGIVPAWALAELGGFDEHLSTSADLEFAARFALHHPVEAVPDVLSLYRTHSGQMHLAMAPYEHDMLRIYEDRFGGDPALAPIRRRATANLYTRIFFHQLLAGHHREAWRAFAIAVHQRPDRLVALPISVVARRSRRQVDLLIRRARPGRR